MMLMVNAACSFLVDVFALLNKRETVMNDAYCRPVVGCEKNFCCFLAKLSRMCRLKV